LEILSSELKVENLVHGVYYTVGGDVYWLNNAEKIFRSILPEESFSLHVLDKVRSMEEVLNAVDTIGFSGDDNVVIVKDADYKLTEKDKELLKNFACEGYILFIGAKFFDPKKDDKYKGLSFSAAERKLFNVIKCEKSDKYACATYIAKLFPNGIERTAALALAEYANCDMARIYLEAEKLNAYCEGRRTEKTDVTDLVAEDTDLQIFNFVNSVLSGNKSLALKQLARLKKRGESPSVLLAALINQYRRTFYASISPLSDKELADLLKVKEYAVTKARENRAISKKQLKKTIETLVDYEYKFKTGVMSDRAAFDAAIAGLLAKESV